MILSMTGYGTATAEYKGKTITAEIKSVNGKYADVNVRLPLAYRDKEMEIRNELSKKFERGKIEMIISVTGASDSSFQINMDAFGEYYKALKQVEKKFKLPPTDYMGTILSFPEATRSSDGKGDEKEWTVIVAAIAKAEKLFENFRKHEGAQLEKDFVLRINNIAKLLAQAEPHEKRREENIRKKINAGLKEWMSEENIDRNRLEQEMVFYIEKMDFTEEKTRLRSHCSYFLQTLSE